MSDIEDLLEIEDIDELKSLTDERYFGTKMDGAINFLADGKGEYLEKELMYDYARTYIDKNGNCWIVDDNDNLLDREGNYIPSSKGGGYILAIDDGTLKIRKGEDGDLEEKNPADNFPEKSKISPYELLMEDKGKMEQFLGDISGFCQNNYKDKIEAIDNKNKEIEAEINELKKNIDEYDSKSDREKVALGPKEDLETKKKEHEKDKEKLERVKKSYEVFQGFTQAASENVEEIKRMYEYYNTLENDKKIKGKQRDEVKQKIAERTEKLHKQLQIFQKNVNQDVATYIDEINEGNDVDLNKANLDCQLAIIKERTNIEQKQNREINKEQLQLWKDEFSDNPEAKKRVDPERKDRLVAWEQELDRVSDGISEKQGNLDGIYDQEDKIGEIEDITKDITDPHNKDYGGLYEKQSNYETNHSINWDDVHDIESFMKFVKERFFGNYDKAKEHYNNYGKNDFIKKNGIDKAVNLAKDGENTLKNESEKNPKERAEEALKFEMVNYLVDEKGENLDIEEAKEIIENAKFDEQPLKQYAKNLETIYKKKEKIQNEGNIPLTLEKIGKALEQGVEENSVGLKRRFITKKTKESATYINNSVMGAITEKVKEIYGDNAEFNNLSSEKKSIVLRESLTNFNIGEGVTTNSIFASDRRAADLVMQGLKNIKDLVEKSTKDEVVLEECNKQIKEQIKNAQNAIKEKSARCASEYYKKEIEKEKEKEKVDYTKVKELQSNFNKFKGKEGEFKGGLVDRFKKVVTPFVETVDKDAIRRKNVTKNQLTGNAAIDALKFDNTKKKLYKNLKSQSKTNREEQRKNSKNSKASGLPSH